MKPPKPARPTRPPQLIASLAALWLFATPSQAHASFMHGETLDTVADFMSWAVLFIVPIVLVTVFIMVHVLPEKIAHKKGHPQTAAIQCLCLLSLVFGGLLWPIAWLWAYTKPVLYKMAYGTDRIDDHDHTPASDIDSSTTEIEQLRARIAELEARNQGGTI